MVSNYLLLILNFATFSSTFPHTDTPLSPSLSLSFSLILVYRTRALLLTSFHAIQIFITLPWICHHKWKRLFLWPAFKYLKFVLNFPPCHFSVIVFHVSGAIVVANGVNAFLVCDFVSILHLPLPAPRSHALDALESPFMKRCNERRTRWREKKPTNEMAF